MIWLAYISIALLIYRFGTALVNLTSRHWLRDSPDVYQPMVSVLIPARNEERSIGMVLQDLVDLDYANMEIIVYNDSSDDRTGEIVREFAASDERIRLVEGVELPDGWMGKNHACHRLADLAGGEYLLFLDADVRVNQGLIRKSLAHMRRHHLSLVSIFPKQVMITFGEWLVVPLMNVILVGLLPMPLVRMSRRPSLAAANGQFMLFDARVYRQHRFHFLLRDRNVEDIHTSRLMKSMGYRIDTLLSGGEVECRMYGGFRDAVQGFTRNMFAFFGGSNMALMAYLLFTTAGVVFVWLGISFQAVLAYLGASVLMRLMISLASRQHALLNILLSPLQQAAMIAVSAEAFRRKRRRSNTWKGRKIVFEGK